MTGAMSGFLCLAIVLDVFSRKIVGWSMETHLHTELMLTASRTSLGEHVLVFVLSRPTHSR